MVVASRSISNETRAAMMDVTDYLQLGKGVLWRRLE
jgi:hypothetical protein